MQKPVALSVKIAYLVVLAAVFVSCETVPNNGFTTAEGIVTNRYTGLPVVGAPVTVGRNSSGFGYRQYDSLTTAYTDANGHYALSFNATKQNNSLIIERYVIHVLYSPTLYDLTNQPSSYPWDGTTTTKGQSNKINLEVTPYKKVTVRIPAGKAGGNTIYLTFNSIDRDNWFGNIILADTNRRNQFIGFTRVLNVLPNRDYRFYNTLSDNKTSATETRDRRVQYNDTTTVVFR